MKCLWQKLRYEQSYDNYLFIYLFLKRCPSRTLSIYFSLSFSPSLSLLLFLSISYLIKLLLITSLHITSYHIAPHHITSHLITLFDAIQPTRRTTKNAMQCYLDGGDFKGAMQVFERIPMVSTAPQFTLLSVLPTLMKILNM